MILVIMIMMMIVIIIIILLIIIIAIITKSDYSLEVRKQNIWTDKDTSCIKYSTIHITTRNANIITITPEPDLIQATGCKYPSLTTIKPIH
jgi:hypothetical protein